MRTNKLIPISLSAVIVIGLTIGVALIALAVHDLEFELDGNIADDGAGVDWANFFNSTGTPITPLPTNFVASSFTTDFVMDASGPDRTTFTTGSKDTLNISPGWQCARSNNVNDKIDLLNVYATAYADPGNGDTIIYFALERFSNDGDANVAFWFLQDPTVGCIAPASGPSTTSFTGTHIDGDLLIVSSFTKGGVVSTVTGYQWVGGADGYLDTTPVFNQKDCKTTTGSHTACATVNDPTNGAITPPWPTQDKDGDNSLNISEFYEGGVNLDAVGLGGRCFNKFLANTRSSQSLTATLFDFAGGDLPLCNLAVDKTGDTLSKVGDAADYTITITNTGGITLYKEVITDTLLGDITIDGLDLVNANVVTNGCDASLAAGDSFTITLSRTVLAGDSDPLPNTVTVIYNAKLDLTGDSITRDDDHSVNLFQPDISVTKACTDLSKIGDPVSCTVVITNDSSDDTPDLVFDKISDTVQGDLTDSNNYTTLTCGTSIAWDGSCTITYSYNVPASATDPYPNTVTVESHPTGFDNDIDATASDSVNLFQPDISVTKACTNLSKVGDPVNCTVVITNDSSDDTPDLIFDKISDSVQGDLTNSAKYTTSTCGTSIAWDEFCTITYSYIVPASATDPYPNTVTIESHPTGFDNDIDATASDSVNLFQPDISVTKACTDLSKVGDPVNCTVVITNDSSDDTPDLVFDKISDSVQGDLTLLANYTTSTCGSSLAWDEFCTIIYSYIVPEGADDPYDNTVTVESHPTGFDNDIDATASDSVNLFQPAIAVNKTGDLLGKIGDPVDYTVTLSNNSSADTPALTCTANDTLKGSLFTGVLPLGDKVITYSRTVLALDHDPLVNTTSMTCTIAGFSNILTSAESHTTQLFQPGVEVIKTGPATAARGQTVTYSFTINNLSSSDSPNLILDSVTDTVLGNLKTTAIANGCGTLAPSGSCNFTADYLTQASDPNPLVNVVTVLYHPEGFPNEITDDDDHSLSFPTQGCTPGWWKNQGLGAFNDPSDPLAIAVTTAVADYWYGGVAPAGFDGTHNALFRDAFNLTSAQMTAVGLDPNLTLLGAIELNGGNYFALARQGTSALLNSVSVDYPYEANQVLQMMHDAIVNQNLDDLVNVFNDANNLDHSSCPTG